MVPNIWKPDKISGFQMVEPFEIQTLKSPVFRWIRFSGVRYLDGYCTLRSCFYFRWNWRKFSWLPVKNGVWFFAIWKNRQSNWTKLSMDLSWTGHRFVRLRTSKLSGNCQKIRSLIHLPKLWQKLTSKLFWIDFIKFCFWEYSRHSVNGPSVTGINQLTDFY